MVVFINIERILRYNLNFKPINYNRKYTKSTILKVFNLISKDTKIKDIIKQTGVPETTIRNWKNGYTNLFGTNNKLTNDIKKQILSLVKEGYNIPSISKKLKLNYDTVRLFIKETLSTEGYGSIKLLDKKLLQKDKLITPELSYILGVMYGDGYFGKRQIRLGTIDKDFADYFNYIVQKWSNKAPNIWEKIKNDKPYYECYLSFKDATEFIKSIVKDRKEIPEIITNSNNKEIIMMFIKGFSDSEGTIIINNKMNTFKVYNQNRYVLWQIKNMMLKLGFDEKKLYIVENNKAKNGIVYALRMSYKDQIRQFYEVIGFTIRRKQQKLESLFNDKLNREDMAAVV